MKVELQGIHKAYGAVRANDGVTFTIESGAIHGLLGENGAGKTTLMKVLSGYVQPDAGRILLDGRPTRFATPADAIASGVGMLHQDPLDVPSLTVADNYSLGQPRGAVRRRHDVRRRLAALCAQSGFELDPDERVGNLTIGERQQLEIVRLLSLGVRTLILDEPTTGISAPQRRLLFRTLRDLAAGGMSVIFVSHKLEEVQELCGRVTVLREGRVAGHATAPYDPEALVRMMFGRCLNASTRGACALGEVRLELVDATIHTYRLDVPDVSLRVRAGEVIGLAGLEGSGQRLLMEACAGMVPLCSGRILLDGHDMTGRPFAAFRSAGAAFVPAARLELALVPGMTLREHFALTGDGDGFFVRWEEAQARTEERIREFSIVGRPEMLVQELSGGNQQRAVLSLLPDDLRVLALEHPTRGLDLESAHAIWQRLLRRRERGTAILFASTDLDELVEYSDRIVVFSGGRASEPVEAADVTCEELGFLIGGATRERAP